MVKYTKINLKELKVIEKELYFKNGQYFTLKIESWTTNIFYAFVCVTVFDWMLSICVFPLRFYAPLPSFAIFPVGGDSGAFAAIVFAFAPSVFWRSCVRIHSFTLRILSRWSSTVRSHIARLGVAKCAAQSARNSSNHSLRTDDGRVGSDWRAATKYSCSDI